VLAEIELTSEDERFELPDWAGAEVSDDPRYYNSNLASHPFRRW
jgi:adenylate cyclase